MSCVLRVSAPNIETAVAGCALKPFRLEDGTAHFEVSRAGLPLTALIDAAISFLRRFQEEIGQLMALPSAAGFLDFAVANPNRDVLFGRLSAELVCLSGKAGLGLELSLDPVAGEGREHS